MAVAFLTLVILPQKGCNTAIQKRATKMTKRMNQLPYEGRLQLLRFFLFREKARKRQNYEFSVESG